ncbi:restriction endonuclease subunit S [Acinetobacter indicus]|uniref:restriction endonuclease subunit S n=1 Tax=Acinetobacter indicus TaxID=756892 RepID=UPI003989D457
MDFKQYPSYEDSGVEWLGEVPEHWNLKRFCYLFAENKKKNIGLKETNVLSLSYGNIKEKKIDDNKGLLPESFETYQIIEPNDIVFRFTDLQNDKRSLRSAISKYHGIITSAYIAVKTKQNADFYNYLFRAYDLQKVFYSMGEGMRQSLKMDELNKMPVVLPSEDEQKRIVSFLDTETIRIDNLISKQEKLIELLEEQRKSIISHAVTKGLNPNAPMKDSGVEWLGDVPEHWNLKPIKFLAKTNQLTLAENTDENYEIQYVDIGSVSRTNGIEKIETILFKDAPSRARRIVKDGDIIVSTVRTYLKAIAYIENPPKNLIVSTGFAVLNPIRTVIFPQYAKFTFLAEQFIAEVIAKSKGISYPAITATELADIKIALPPLNEQKVILQYLLEENLKMNKLISKQNQLIEKLKEYRASIISHAVTGKIDVREFGA